MIVTGSIGGPTGEKEDGKSTVAHYWIVYFEKPSYFGINEGRIIKLIIIQDEKITCIYGNGWVIEPEDESTKTVLALLLKKYN